MMDLASRFIPGSTAVLGPALGAVLLSLAYGIVSRLVLSPIANFPGPKLAGLTFWYEFYYDVIKGGRYTWKIRELHDKYGPIIRINPEELHVDDPSFYPKLYSGPSEKRDKWGWSMKLFGNSSAAFSTLPHELHRRRRAALNPSFSKAAVARLEPEIRVLVDRLCQRLLEFQASGKPVNLGVVFSALATDVVTKYSFGNAYGCLEAPDFRPLLYEAVQGNTKTTVVAKQFGWVIPLSRKLPHWMVNALTPIMMQMIHFAAYIYGECQSVIDSQNDKSEAPKHPTIFHSILESDLEPHDKSVFRLMDEGTSVVGAGLSSTADTLRMTAFHILNRPVVLHRLKDELASAIPDPGKIPLLKNLEQLPYLSAVVAEGYRIACGICSRLQRISPHTPLTFNDWVIPRGTPVSMTSYLIHNRPDIFPNPKEFRPERWLESREGPAEERLDRYLVQFSRGTRACVGMNLAHAEIYLTLAYLFRRFDMELFETTREDVDIEHDYFTAFPKLDSKGVRIMIK